MTRVLFAKRISSDRKESMSIETQDDLLMQRAIERQAAGETIDVLLDPANPSIRGAEDRTVSGDVDMMDRPALGQWLTKEGLQEWDELWVTKQDRLSRNDMHVMAFIFEMIQANKTVVILDDPNWDMHTPEGRAIIHVKCIGPAAELRAIKQRIRDSYDARRWTGMHETGIPGYGYTTVSRVINVNGQEKHRKFKVLDEYETTVLHEMRNWLVNDGQSFNGVAEILNARGELTNYDRWRSKKGLKTASTPWSATVVGQLMTNPALRGYKMQNGKPLHNKDGTPFQPFAPVFNEEEWETLQTACANRSIVHTRVNGASPLVNVAFCGRENCKRAAYRNTSWYQDRIMYAYYRCLKCKGVRMKAEDVEALVEEAFLELVGEADMPAKMWDPGEDRTRELEDVERQIVRLDEDRDAGVFDSDPSEYQEKAKALRARRAELSKLPQRKAGWVLHDTGVTYRAAWAKGTAQDRRKMLIDAGVRIEIHDKFTANLFIPENIKERVPSA